MRKTRKQWLREASELAAQGGGRASEPDIAKAYEGAGLSPSVAAKAAREARLLAASGKAAQEPPAPTEWARLSEADAEALRGMLPGLSPDEGALICAMLLCMRARPHPSGRIRYEDRELMGCAGIASLKAYRAAFSSLHGAGLAECAAVGSKSPITALSLPWAREDGGEAEAISRPFAKNEGKALAKSLAEEDA